MTKLKYLMVLLSTWFKRLFWPKNQYPAIDGNSFIQRRNTAYIFFVHSGLTALMAKLYILRYQIPQEQIYVVHGGIGKSLVQYSFKELVGGDVSRLFEAGNLAHNFWKTLSGNPRRIRKYYFKHFNRFLKSTLAYIGEADFVAVCNSLDHSVARAFYEHPQCCKLVMCEEGTSSYIPSLEMSLAPDYNEKIQNFVAKHPKWAYQQSKLIPAKLISNYNVLEIYNPRLIKDNKIEIFRLTDLAYQHLEASWREAIDTLPTMSAESAQSTASNITKEKEREKDHSSNDLIEKITKSDDFTNSSTSHLNNTTEINHNFNWDYRDIYLQFTKVSRSDFQRLQLQSILLQQMPELVDSGFNLSPDLQHVLEVTKTKDLWESSRSTKSASTQFILDKVDNSANISSSDFDNSKLETSNLDFSALPWSEKIHLLPLDKIPHKIFDQKLYLKVFGKLLRQIKDSGVTQLLIKTHHSGSKKYLKLINKLATKLDLKIFWLRPDCQLEWEYIFFPKHSIVVHSIASSTLLYALEFDQEIRCYFDLLEEYPSWLELYREINFEILDWLEQIAKAKNNRN